MFTGKTNIEHRTSNIERAVLRRFMGPEQFKKEQAASHEPLSTGASPSDRAALQIVCLLASAFTKVCPSLSELVEML